MRGAQEWVVSTQISLAVHAGVQPAPPLELPPLVLLACELPLLLLVCEPLDDVPPEPEDELVVRPLLDEATLPAAR